VCTVGVRPEFGSHSSDCAICTLVLASTEEEEEVYFLHTGSWPVLLDTRKNTEHSSEKPTTLQWNRMQQAHDKYGSDVPGCPMFLVVNSNWCVSMQLSGSNEMSLGVLRRACGLSLI